MEKWKYIYAVAVGDKVIRVDEMQINPPHALMIFLQDMGRDGWELVSSGQGTMGLFLFFKKPLQE